MTPQTILAGAILTAVVIVIVLYLASQDKKQAANQANWVDPELDDRLLPADGEKVTWIDFNDQLLEGWYIKSMKLFYVSPKIQTHADNVKKWQSVNKM